jgi:hypothetical protein
MAGGIRASAEARRKASAAASGPAPAPCTAPSAGSAASSTASAKRGKPPTVIGYAAYQVAEWLASVLVAILIAASIMTAAALATLVVVLRHQRGRTHLGASQWVVERLDASRIQSHRALPIRPAAAIPVPSRRSRRPQSTTTCICTPRL